MLSIQQSKKLMCLLHVCHCIVKHSDEAKDRLLIAVLVLKHLKHASEQGTHTDSASFICILHFSVTGGGLNLRELYLPCALIPSFPRFLLATLFIPPFSALLLNIVRGLVVQWHPSCFHYARHTGTQPAHLTHILPPRAPSLLQHEP